MAAKFVARTAGALALVGSLAACGLFNRTDTSGPVCPSLAVPADTGRIIRFRDGPGRDLTDVAFTATVADPAGSCIFDKSGVNVEMKVALTAERGPAAPSGVASTELRYYVAIVDLTVPDPRAQILAKRVFPTRADFTASQARVGVVEELEQRIPLPGGGDAGRFRIVVGFDLSPEELATNRRRFIGG